MNEKLALNDDILMKIEKPARYIGNEVNAVVKDKNSVDVRFLCGVCVYILPGWIWMPLCGRSRFRCLPWKVRIR